MTILRIAVVGAGLAGLSCARALKDHGYDVTILDKGRHAGGRLASRLRDSERFDYGAQYFTARDQRFRKQVDFWLAEGVAQPWRGQFGILTDGRLVQSEPPSQRFVGVPQMSTITEHLSEGLDVRLLHRVDQIEQSTEHGDYRLFGTTSGSDTGSGDFANQFELRGFDFVVLNMPPKQANAIAPFPALSDVILAPCWAIMVSFDERLDFHFDGIIVKDGPLSWVARDSSKPQRPSGERWMLHASRTWSTQYLEEPGERVSELLINALEELHDKPLPAKKFVKAHRWRYALAVNPLESGYLFDAKKRIGYCGDWCAGNRVEGAYLSGIAMAERIMIMHGSPTS